MVGIVIPVLPGLLLVLAAVLRLGLDTGTPLAGGCSACAAALYVAGVALQYAVPGRRMRAAGVRHVDAAAGGAARRSWASSSSPWWGPDRVRRSASTSSSSATPGTDATAWASTKGRPQGGLPVDGDRAARRDWPSRRPGSSACCVRAGASSRRRARRSQRSSMPVHERPAPDLGPLACWLARTAHGAVGLDGAQDGLAPRRGEGEGDRGDHHREADGARSTWWC